MIPSIEAQIEALEEALRWGAYPMGERLSLRLQLAELREQLSEQEMEKATTPGGSSAS